MHKINHLKQLATHSFSTNFIITAGSNFFIATLGAAGGIIAARYLGATGRGELAAAVVWSAILGIVVQVGLPQAITYHVAKYTEQSTAILQSALTWLLIQSIVVLTVGSTIATLLLGYSESTALYAVRIYLFSLPFMMLTTYLNVFAQGQQKFGLFSFFRVASASGLIISLAFAYILELNSVVSLLVLMVLYQALVAITALIWFSKNVVPLNTTWHTNWMRPLIKYGFKSYLGSLSWIANGRLDQFIMSLLLPLNQLGIYAVSVSFAGVLFPVTGAFANILFPRVATGKPDDHAKIIWRTLAATIIFSGIGALILGLLSASAIPWLFGDEFSTAIKPAYILLLGSVFLSANYVLSDALRGTGYPGWPSISEIVGLLITISGLLLLLSHYGILGAAWVSTFSYFITFIFLLGGLLKLLKPYKGTK